MGHAPRLSILLIKMVPVLCPLLWDAPRKMPSAQEQDGRGPWRTSWEGQGRAPTPHATGPSDWWPGARLREHGPLPSRSPIGSGEPLEGVSPSGPTKSPGVRSQGPLHRVPLPWRGTVITEPDHTHIPATNPGDTCCPLGSQKHPDLHVYKPPPPLWPLASPDAHQDLLGPALPQGLQCCPPLGLASLGLTGPKSPTWAQLHLQHPTPRGRAEAPLTFPTRPARPTAQDGQCRGLVLAQLPCCPVLWGPLRPPRCSPRAPT